MFALCTHSSGETHNHLFLRCPISWAMWQRLMAIDHEMWVIPSRVEYLLLTSFIGFGKRKDNRILWWCAIFITLWSVWTETNSRIIKEHSRSRQLLWDRTVFLASFWWNATRAFTGISLAYLKQDQSTLLSWVFSFIFPTDWGCLILYSLSYILLFLSNKIFFYQK